MPTLDTVIHNKNVFGLPVYVAFLTLFVLMAENMHCSNGKSIHPILRNYKYYFKTINTTWKMGKIYVYDKKEKHLSWAGIGCPLGLQLWW